MSEYGQPNPQQRPTVPPFPEGGHPPIQPRPPKKHTVRNVILGVFVGIFLVIGGCTALVGGALSSQDAKAPTAVTSKAGTPVASSTPKPQPSPKVTHKPAPTTTKPVEPAMTAGQEQAIGSAQEYLSMQAFSRKGLIKQLSSEYGEGFSVADATFAVDHITVDWNEQAVLSAKQYLSMQHFSRSGLIHQLESAYGEQFTHSQAVYGVTKAGL